MKPLLIGLPGAGKSTTAAAYAQKYGLKIISTDALFRVYRAIPLDSKDEGVEVMVNFLTRVKSDFPHLANDIIEAAKADETGEAKLRDSKLFRNFGENVFRTFEIEMLKWLNAKGEFDSALPDLSASAPLFVENQLLFSRDYGFQPIYLDVSKELLIERLYNDYLEYERTNKRKRGAYELAVEGALAQVGDISDSDRRSVIIRA